MKKRIIHLFSLALFLLATTLLHAQQGHTTVGIQLKPIVPNTLFNSGPNSFNDENWSVDIRPNFSTTFGMVIRHGLTDRWSIEGGISYVPRNYQVDVTFNDTAFTNGDFKLVSYEFPVAAMVYIQLGKQLYMNNSLGVSIDMFASDTKTNDGKFISYTARRNWLQASIIGNVGFELRTEEKGYFYLGASLHRPFNTIGTTTLQYYRTPTTEPIVTELKLTGNYLTIDFRYYFHEEVPKKKKKR